jgi:hypothetical protein
MYYSIRNVFIISIFILLLMLMLVILTSIDKNKNNIFNYGECKIMQYYMIITTPY